MLIINSFISSEIARNGLSGNDRTSHSEKYLSGKQQARVQSLCETLARDAGAPIAAGMPPVWRPR
jgi:hypothetical protein